MNNSKAHTDLVNAVLKEYGSNPNVRIWKNATGVARTLNGDDNNFIKFGLVGSSDIIGIWKPTGKILCFEIKTGTAKQTQTQKNFEKMISDFGGVYVLVRQLSDLDFLRVGIV